jgi:glyoxylase-like metal-dependent hydrolase (beta-lactamase superfamily II)
VTTRRFEFSDVGAFRVGRFNLGISTSCIVYRLGSGIIDTGPPNQWSIVRRFVEEKAISHVLVTHHHEDHSGNAARVHTEITGTVLFPPTGLAFARDGFRLRPYQRVVWGVPERFVPEPMPDEVRLAHGVRLRAIHTPGHSPDMTCFLEPERGWLFSGDLYIASRPRLLRADENVDDEIESLQRVLDLDFETVFCAHRGVVTDGKRAIRTKLDYLTSLRDEVRELHDEGKSIRAITRTLLGRESLMTLITSFHFSKRNLVRKCLERRTA